MAKKHPNLTPALREFIESQKLFFVGTAAADGRVNVSPKGLDTLRVTGDKTIVWLNLTGSGNETAAHVLVNPRMTLMFCAFEGKPQILRVYGNARAIAPGDPNWAPLLEQFPPQIGARQLFELSIELVLTSCGMAVPLYGFEGHRSELVDWAERRGRSGVLRYQREHNQVSLDGKATGLGSGSE